MSLLNKLMYQVFIKGNVIWYPISTFIDCRSIQYNDFIEGKAIIYSNCGHTTENAYHAF